CLVSWQGFFHVRKWSALFGCQSVYFYFAKHIYFLICSFDIKKSTNISKFNFILEIESLHKNLDSSSKSYSFGE
ncbi:hypothetical protein, partial [Brevibacillus brevis]|uniref:hypothetical protein n=1 Tax=Brevibacillus brevis TaxID=1393 RepID=UPI0037C5562D